MDNWSNRPHGKRQQAQVIPYILGHVDYFEAAGYSVPMSRIFKECEEELNVCCSTVQKWWLSFELYGELPYKTKAHLKKIKT